MSSADIIIKSSSIFNSIDSIPFSGIVAVSGNRIVYAGSDSKSDKYTGDNTKIMDFGDCLVIPGIHDAHMHFYMASLYDSKYVYTSFNDTSKEDFIAGLSQNANIFPKDRWLIGFGWYHWHWKEAALPDKSDLDTYYPDRPVIMISVDFHTVWVNSCGIERLGRDTLSDEAKKTGILHEKEAFGACRKVYSEFSFNEECGFYGNFMKKLNRYGITSVCDMSMMPEPGADFIREDIYEALLADNKMTCRVNMYPTLREDLSRPMQMMKKYTGNILRCQGAKQFFDGVSCSHTAYLAEDYSNAAFPGDRGFPAIPENEMRSIILNAHRNGISTRVHTIGDQAIHFMLDVLDEAVRIYGKNPEVVHCLEHLENFLPEDIVRSADSETVFSVQPAHVLIDTLGVEKDLGAERVKDMWPFRRLIDNGRTLAFGTDCPVVDINPFLGIYNAVTSRSAFDGKPDGGWHPEDNITLAEAITAYTAGAAKAANRFDELGTLEEGKLADIAVLDRNLFELEASQIPGTKVLLTMMNGEIV